MSGDAVDRLREKAQNEATCFALNDLLHLNEKELAKLKQERDELAAQVELLNSTINSAMLDMVYKAYDDSWQCFPGTYGAFEKLKTVVQRTGPAALAEIQARTLDTAADNPPSCRLLSWPHMELHDMAAAKRKGE